MKQPYLFSGTLSGSSDIDYRILVDGPCGEPIGTYNEQWIACGVFSGSLNDQSVSSAFTYVAHVKTGGDVEGELEFGPGLHGKLRVRGNFGDGRLSYAGKLYK